MEINSQISNLSRPHGSALYSLGDTTVLAGIYGPVEVKTNKVLIEKAYLETHYRPKSGLPCVDDKLRDSIIHNICEVVIAGSLYRRSSIVIVVQEMQSGKEILSCAINAICLAALDSGIDMKCMFGAVSCFLDDNDILHLNSKFITNTKATFVLVFDSVAKKLLASHTEGTFTSNQFQEAVNLCRNHVDTVFDYYRNILGVK